MPFSGAGDETPRIQATRPDPGHHDPRPSGSHRPRCTRVTRSPARNQAAELRLLGVSPGSFPCAWDGDQAFRLWQVSPSFVPRSLWSCRALVFACPHKFFTGFVVSASDFTQFIPPSLRKWLTQCPLAARNTRRVWC